MSTSSVQQQQNSEKDQDRTQKYQGKFKPCQIKKLVKKSIDKDSTRITSSALLLFTSYIDATQQAIFSTIHQSESKKRINGIILTNMIRDKPQFAFLREREACIGERDIPLHPTLMGTMEFESNADMHATNQSAAWKKVNKLVERRKRGRQM